MTAIELLNMLTEYAKKYRKDVVGSLQRNKHMHEYHAKSVPQELVDAVLVDFIDSLAAEKWGIDYALYTSDLVEDNKQ